MEELIYITARDFYESKGIVIPPDGVAFLAALSKRIADALANAADSP